MDPLVTNVRFWTTAINTHYNKHTSIQTPYDVYCSTGDSKRKVTNTNLLSNYAFNKKTVLGSAMFNEMRCAISSQSKVLAVKNESKTYQNSKPNPHSLV